MVSPPSQTHFSSHLNQTVNSMRRQTKTSFDKQADAFSKEDQIKSLLKRIKQKKTMLKTKARNNGNSKEILQQELRNNALFQNDIPRTDGLDDLESPMRLLG